MKKITIYIASCIVAMTATMANAATEAKCAVVFAPGIYDLEVPAFHTVDFCSGDTSKVEAIHSAAEVAGWRWSQKDGAFYLSASSESKPSNLIVKFKDGSRAEYRVRTKATGSTTLTPVTN